MGRPDHRAEVRESLSSRRARITPDQAGLPAYGGNRRVAGLRREEVVLLAGVSIDHYVRLERGNLSGTSASVLDAVSRALQLDEAERARSACSPCSPRSSRRRAQHPDGTSHQGRVLTRERWRTPRRSRRVTRPTRESNPEVDGFAGRLTTVVTWAG